MLVFVALRVAAEVTRRAAPPCFSRVVVTAAVPPLPSTCPPFLLMFGAASGVACKAGTFNLVVFDRQAPLFRRWSDILAVLVAGTTPGSRRKTFWTVGCWKPSRAGKRARVFHWRMWRGHLWVVRCASAARGRLSPPPPLSPQDRFSSSRLPSFSRGSFHALFFFFFLPPSFTCSLFQDTSAARARARARLYRLSQYGGCLCHSLPEIRCRTLYLPRFLFRNLLPVCMPERGITLCAFVALATNTTCQLW